MDITHEHNIDCFNYLTYLLYYFYSNENETIEETIFRIKRAYEENKLNKNTAKLYERVLKLAVEIEKVEYEQKIQQLSRR
jgi:hypothetical protein